MAITRVYLLANELGVKSTAIIEKCQAEGLDVKNHMSTISAGLAATIREWFSEGDHQTAVEITDRVNLGKARVPIRKRKAKKEEEQQSGETTVTEVAVEPGIEEISPMQQDQPEESVATEEKTEQKEQEKEKTETPAPAPEPVMPAGPMLGKPAPAKLNGPRVVRVEAAEPMRSATPPKPKPLRIARPPRYDGPVTEPLLYGEELRDKFGLKQVKAKKGTKVVKGKERIRQPDVVLGAEEAEKWPKAQKKLRQRDIEERRARLDAAGGESLRLRPSRKIETDKHDEVLSPIRPQKVTLSEPITIKSLSAAIGSKSSDIIAHLLQQGIVATANQIISSNVAELIAIELGTELAVVPRVSLEQEIAQQFEKRERKNLKRRPPVVTMLGHVDHGKTSLLDKIRSANVAKGEAGGITQHMGAYQVTRDDKKVTFLDTPGHEAFTAMRARGANMTDIVVLVVAADDGVMPQTIEAIHHAKAAKVPIIVALNKTDLPGYDINRIYGQLAEHELSPVEWSGQTEIVKTSAVTGQGIADLLEHLDYIAELLDLKADAKIPATGWVIEAKMTPHQGPVATILIKEGRLRKGDIILAGQGYGRVRSLTDSFGKSTKEATPSMPLEITGLDDVPQAGDRFYCLDDINVAKQAAEENRTNSREKSLAKRQLVTLENLFSQIEAGSVKELNIIVRADVQGSVDVLVKYLNELSTDEVKIRILHAAVGGINKGDAVLAEASEAIIIGFNVVPEDEAAKMAEAKGIDIRLYSIIYRITEDLRSAMAGLLKPREEERQLGRAVVRNTFKVSNVGKIAGCFVLNGVVSKNAKARLIRNNVIIKDTCAIESMKHFKDDAREVKAGLECGIKIAGFDDVKTEDVIEFYEIVKVAREL